jgi:hypothetical protein
VSLKLSHHALPRPRAVDANVKSAIAGEAAAMT